MTEELGHDEVTHGLEQLKVLAEPDRLRILATLLEAPANAPELSERLGCGLNEVVDHLDVLADVGLIECDSDGCYSLCKEVSTAWLAMGGGTAIDLGCCRLRFD